MSDDMESAEAFTENWYAHNQDELVDLVRARDRLIAAAAAKAERERCERACLNIAEINLLKMQCAEDYGYTFARHEAMNEAAENCVAAIRALPDPEPAT